tara:strand:- start:503 stop:706 length:204 start_codon:yes stop_codon:yes gene_type:complete
MDCGFYIIYIYPDKKISKRIADFWEEQRIISNMIRDTYDIETENKFFYKSKKSLDIEENNKDSGGAN